jgi:hypothetical protein
MTAASRVGVVFVHGIGSQKPEDTLLDWSSSFLQPVWSDPASEARLTKADLLGDVKVVEVSMRRGAGKQEWLLTEAFWARSVHPPSFEAVAGWLGEAAGAATSGILGSRRQRVFVSAAAAAVLLAYGFLRALLALIPFAAAERAITASIDGLLTGWVGDLLVLANDPVQSAAIHLRLTKTIDYLRVAQGCDRIVVIAHSGGAAVAVGMLRVEPQVRVDALITLGQGLALISRMSEPTMRSATWNRSLGVATAADRASFAGNPRRWVDYWASRDPATVGPLPSSIAGRRFVSRPVENRRSWREDHGGYWDNLEEFVLPVLDELASTRPTSRYYRGTKEIETLRRRDRHFRVGILEAWRRYCAVLPAITVLLALFVYPPQPSILERIGDAVGDLLGWLPLHDLVVSAVGFFRVEGVSSTAAGWIVAIGNIALYSGVAGLVVFVASALLAKSLLQTESAASPVVGLVNIVLLLAGVGVPVSWFLVAVVGGNPGFPIAITPPAAIPYVAVGAGFGIAGLGVLGLTRIGTSAVGIVSLTLVAAVAIPAMAVTSFLATPALGRLALGAGVVLGCFGIAQKVGQWRWESWDRAERQALFGSSRVNRRWLVAEGSVLVIALAALTLAFAFPGPVDRVWLPLAVAAVGLLAVVFVGLARDADRNASGG